MDGIVTAERRQAEQGPLDLAVGVVSGEVVGARGAVARLHDRRPRGAGLFHAGGRAPHAGVAGRALEPSGGAAHLLSRWLARLVAAGLLVAEGDGARRAPRRCSTGALGGARAEARAALAGHAGPARVRRALRSAAGRDPVGDGESAGDAVPGRQRRDRRGPLPAVAGRALHERARPRRGRGAGSAPSRRTCRSGSSRSARAPAARPRRCCPRCPAERTRLRLHRRVDVLPRPRGAREFAAYPFVRTALLDIERTPPSRDGRPAAIDVVVAANVLHATRDLRPDARATCAAARAGRIARRVRGDRAPAVVRRDDRPHRGLAALR